MIAAAFVVVAALAAVDDPAAPLPPALVDDPAAEAPVVPTTPPVESPVVVDELARCKALAADGKLDDAETCFRAHDTPRAVAMRDVVAAWKAPAQATQAPGVTQTVPNDRAQLSLSGLVESGTAEGMLHGAVAGAGAGFLGAATVFSANRANQNDSLPWLIASPAIGAVAGAAGSYFLLENTKPTTGDIALSASTMWTGAGEGFLLQLAVFDKNPDVSTIPLRFATVLAGGALGLGTGIALSPVVDITQGDAAVANSALLWGGVLTGFGLGIISNDGTIQLSATQIAFALMGGSLVPYGVALACHPLLKIDCWPSWLIEVGGIGGLLTSGAIAVAFGSTLGPTLSLALMASGTAVGVVAGGAAAWVVSANVAPATTTTASPKVAVAPTILLDDDRHATPALAVAGRF